MRQKVPYDVREIAQSVVDWADEVFPERTPEGTITKLTEELMELAENPMDGWEIADVLILVFDLCDMLGFDPAKLVYNKMRVNRSREWELKDGVFKHVSGKEHQNGRPKRPSSAVSKTMDDSRHDESTISGGAYVQCDDDRQSDMQAHGDRRCGSDEGSATARSGRDLHGGHSDSVQDSGEGKRRRPKRAIPLHDGAKFKPDASRDSENS